MTETTAVPAESGLPKMTQDSVNAVVSAINLAEHTGLRVLPDDLREVESVIRSLSTGEYVMVRRDEIEAAHRNASDAVADSERPNLADALLWRETLRRWLS